jgi:hypothetical protein
VSLRFPKGTPPSSSLGLEGPGRGCRPARCARAVTRASLAVGDRVGCRRHRGGGPARRARHRGGRVGRAVRAARRPGDAGRGWPPRRSSSPSRTGTSPAAPGHLADRIVERAGVRQAPPVLRLGVPDTYSSTPSPTRSWPSSASTRPASAPRSARCSATTPELDGELRGTAGTIPLGVRVARSRRCEVGTVAARGGLAPAPRIGNDRATPTEDARAYRHPHDDVARPAPSCSWSLVT